SAVLVLRAVVQLAIEGIGRGEAGVPGKAEHLAMHRIASRLGHYVDETGGRPPYLRSRAGADDLEFLDRRLGKEEDRFVATALVALQRIVEVCSIDGDVRVDGSLPGHDQT